MESKNIQKELERIAKQEEAIAQRKQLLLEAQRKQEEQKQKIKSIYEQSGFSSPESLITALAEAYGVRVPGKTAKREPASTRKPRKRVTTEVAQSVKNALADGLNRNQVAKQFNISYPTVTKIQQGGYDKLV